MTSQQKSSQNNMSFLSGPPKKYLYMLSGLIFDKIKMELLFFLINNIIIEYTQTQLDNFYENYIHMINYIISVQQNRFCQLITHSWALNQKALYINMDNNQKQTQKNDICSIDKGFITIHDRQYRLDQFVIKKIQRQSQQGIFLQSEQISQSIYGNSQTISKLFIDIKKFSFQMCLQDHYKLQKLLGEGAFGKVYKAIHKETKLKFAIKKLQKEELFDKNSPLAREIDILRKLNHETCVHLHEQFIDEKYVYLVLDYVRGGELFDYLDSQKQILGEKSIRNIMLPLFEGIEYLHSIGLIHRDLKPQNILVRNKECLDLVITDFGLSTNVHLEADQNQCGTVGFLAPEIIKGLHYDEKIDIFSLGVILYILYAGEPPFDDKDSTKALKKNRQAIINYNIFEYKGISDQGLDFLKQCLQADPKLRMSAKSALRHPWFSQRNITSSFGIQFISFKSDKKLLLYDQVISIDQIKQNDFEQIESDTFIHDDASVLPSDMMGLYNMDIRINNYKPS
ncbi:hypothetical protein pb186bvf_007255 [Paramecium bursaria]